MAQRDLARYAALIKSNLAVMRQQYDTQRATVTNVAMAIADNTVELPVGALQGSSRPIKSAPTVSY